MEKYYKNTDILVSDIREYGAEGNIRIEVRKYIFFWNKWQLCLRPQTFFIYSERIGVTKLQNGVKYILRGIQDMITEDLDLISLIQAKLFKISKPRKIWFPFFLSFFAKV